MMGPVNAQLTEMKALYENTKSASSEVGGKIEDLKKIIQMQQNSLTGGHSIGGPSDAQAAQMEGFLDPEVIKKGMEEIKAQMREVQREA